MSQQEDSSMYDYDMQTIWVLDASEGDISVYPMEGASEVTKIFVAPCGIHCYCVEHVCCKCGNKLEREFWL